MFGIYVFKREIEDTVLNEDGQYGRKLGGGIIGNTIFYEFSTKIIRKHMVEIRFSEMVLVQYKISLINMFLNKLN